MREINVFNISKGDRTRCELVWSNTDVLVNNTSGFKKIDAEFDRDKYSLLVIIYAVDISYTSDNWDGPGYGSPNYTVHYGHSHFGVVVNDVDIPYPQAIGTTLGEHPGYRTVQLVDNGLSIGEHSNGIAIGIVPRFIYGIR